ncbi:hypothetical protein KSP40_PGU002805 [Platanthera guangdongensis]|uniref:Uncharacterized protein n=1 Tax=Platanthera guangdongensis TaxID=2320717 RepID=A0ABR2LXB5_9ASPA
MISWLSLSSSLSSSPSSSFSPNPSISRRRLRGRGRLAVEMETVAARLHEVRRPRREGIVRESGEGRRMLGLAWKKRRSA